jgi:hypothetical protein
VLVDLIENIKIVMAKLILKINLQMKIESSRVHWKRLTKQKIDRKKIWSPSSLILNKDF